MTLAPHVLAGLFVAMAVLAATPSVSVLLVCTRTASHGLASGSAVAAGIVVADLLFVMLALFGLAFLAQVLGSKVWLIQLAGATYVIALGIRLWPGRSSRETPPPPASSLTHSFLGGLLLTLADQKAILFYFGFFPAFLELDGLRAADILAIALVTIVAVGGVKLIYALGTVRGMSMTSGAAGRRMKRLAAVVMVLAGCVLLARLASA